MYSSFASGGCYTRTTVARKWNEAARAVGDEMTFYEATRHSFVSRNPQRGEALEVVSSAIGN